MVDIQREIKNGFCFGKEEDGLPAIVVSNNGFFVKQDDGTYISLSDTCNEIDSKKEEVCEKLPADKPVLTSYIEAAMSNAKIEKMTNGEYFGELPDCPGVWASEITKSDCYNTLRSVLEEWIILKLMDRDTLPIINGISIKICWEED